MGDIGVAEARLSDGTPLLIKAERVDGSLQGPADVGFRGSLTFSHVTAAVRGIASELQHALQAARPDFVSVELGFDLAISSSQLVALVAQADSSASIQVRLEWREESWRSAEEDADPSDDEILAGSGESGSGTGDS